MRYNRPNKNRGRRDSLLALKPARFRSILTLPGPDALCVREMLDGGLIERSASQVWIENYKPTFDRLPQMAQQMRLTGVDIERTDLEDYDPEGRVFDLVNADMETGVTSRLADWMEQGLAPALRIGSVVVLTTLMWSRNAPFADWMCKNDDPYLRSEFARIGKLIGCGNERVVLPNLILRLALHRYEVQQGLSADYADSPANQMVVTTLRVSRMARRPQRTLGEFLDRFDPQRRSFQRGAVGLVTLLRERLREQHNLVLVHDDSREWAVKVHPAAPAIAKARSIRTLAGKFGVTLDGGRT